MSPLSNLLMAQSRDLIMALLVRWVISLFRSMDLPRSCEPYHTIRRCNTCLSALDSKIRKVGAVVRSLPPNQKAPGAINGLVEGWIPPSYKTSHTWTWRCFRSVSNLLLWSDLLVISMPSRKHSALNFLFNNMLQWKAKVLRAHGKSSCPDQKQIILNEAVTRIRGFNIILQRGD